jgi:NitT/TauT family transport system ATP-binding protein
MGIERRGAAIEIAHLNKVYGNGSAALLALDDINLRVAPGEFLCIVGPSGCGKSTLLRILAGLDRQTGGNIDVQAAGWAVQNAMVFQDSGLFPWMRVATNVGFGLFTRGVPAAEQAVRVEAALKLVGLTKFRNHFPHQLSGGAILQAELVRIWEETGKTVVYITHSIEEALLLGDRTVVMTAQPGRIKEIIDVPFPHPRNLMALSASAEFGRLKLDIWRLLEDEVNRARAEIER